MTHSSNNNSDEPPEPEDETIGDEIKRRRTELGLSRMALEAKSGITRNTIIRIEEEPNVTVRPATIGALRSALDQMEDERSLGTDSSTELVMVTLELPGGIRAKVKGKAGPEVAETILALVERLGLQ